MSGVEGWEEAGAERGRRRLAALVLLLRPPARPRTRCNSPEQHTYTTGMPAPPSPSSPSSRKMLLAPRVPRRPRRSVTRAHAHTNEGMRSARQNDTPHTRARACVCVCDGSTRTGGEGGAGRRPGKDASCLSMSRPPPILSLPHMLPLTSASQPAGTATVGRHLGPLSLFSRPHTMPVRGAG